VLFLLISLYGFISRSKIQIDLTGKKYRKGVHLGSSSLLKWKNLPNNINYVSVLTVNIKSNFKDRYNADSSNSYKSCIINLIHDDRKKLQLMLGLDKDEAINKAKQIAKELNVDIYTVFPGKKEWIYLKDFDYEN